MVQCCASFPCRKVNKSLGSVVGESEREAFFSGDGEGRRGPVNLRDCS